MAGRLADELRSRGNEVTVSEYEGDHVGSLNIPYTDTITSLLTWVTEHGVGDTDPALALQPPTPSSSGNIEAILELAFGSG
jgi:hypothetical protein